jgi:HK97 family phage major capsid protein
MAETNSTKLLREQLGEDRKVIRAMADNINAESRDFTPEEQGAWDTVNAAYDGKAKRLEFLVRADAIDSKLAAQTEINRSLGSSVRIATTGDPAIQPTAKTQAVAFGAWMRSQSGRVDLEEHEVEAARVCGVRLNSQSYEFNRPIGMRQHNCWDSKGIIDYGANLSQFNPSTGGYTVPETFVRTFEIALLQYGGVRQVAEIMTTATGETLTWPCADDTGNQGSQIGESVAVTSTTTTNPAFKAKTWGAYGYTSNFILVPFGLLRDSAFNLADIVSNMMGERVGRKTNAHFTTGDGASKPSGIVTDSALGVTAASATAIAADELYDLEHSIDPSYRGMGCGWMMHDTILKNLRKLKDGQGRYLWQEGMSTGAPNMLLGYPYTISQEMQSSIATATKTILFGLFSKYKVRDVGGVRMIRVNELYAATDNVGFNVISYHDGHLLDAGTNPVKHLLQA